MTTRWRRTISRCRQGCFAVVILSWPHTMASNGPMRISNALARHVEAADPNYYFDEILRTKN